MIPKSQLRHGTYYVGTCRNAGSARWDGQRQVFVYWRTKFGERFLETVGHPEDESVYDAFVPAAEIPPDGEIPLADHSPGHDAPLRQPSPPSPRPGWRKP